MRNLQAQARPIDVVTVEAEIDKQGRLDAVGGVSFLGELGMRVPTADNVLAYAHDVQVLSRNRKVILELASALERAQDWQHDPAELVSEVTGQLQRFAEIDRERTGEAAKVRWCAPLSQFLGDEEPTDDDAEDWIVRDIVPRAEPVLWGGPMKAGKTWAALDLLIAIARGESWMGCENTLGDACPVLGIFLEDSLRRIRKRVWELCRGRYSTDGIVTPNEPTLRRNLHITRAAMRVPDTKDQRRLIGEIKNAGIRFVVVDNLTRVMVGDPNKTSDASVFTRAWSEICEETGASLMFLHHTRKASGADKAQEVDPFDTLRGSGDFGAAARNIIVTSPLRQDDGPVLAEVRMRGNIDLRRDGFVMGFERDQQLGKWRAKLIDKGEIGTVKEEVSKARKERKAEQKKADLVLQIQQRRDRALAIVHAEGAVSQARLAMEFGLTSPRAMEPVLNGMVAAKVLKRDRYRGYVLMEDPSEPVQGGLL
jgi:hypothetical protein